jgi:hypothetical protein
MTSITPASLVEHRQMLQRQLQAQRQLIARQLDPTQAVFGDYPRSMTMRFLNRRSAMVTRLFGEFARILIGARFMKSMTAAMALSRETQAGSTKK